MKLLKIKSNQGYFLNEKKELVTIDKITKENLLRLVHLTLSEDVEFDEYDDDAIKNQAHQILYKNIYERLRDLRDLKEKFIDESERLYLKEYEKYCEKSSQQGAEGDAVTGES